MNNSYQDYFQYLTNRSRFGLMYRNFWLYPRICKHLTGYVLDVGCGTGDFLKYRKQTIGVDINPEVVNFCQKRGLDVLQMEIDHLPFLSGEFDGVVLDNVLEHIISPSLLTKEIYRVLKPAGTLIIGVPGKKGYARDADHKVFYDENKITSTVCAHGFINKVNFYMPLKSSILNTHLPQYCLFSKFVRC